MAEPSFQPFTDRLSRDIRNDLSESIVEVIRTRSLAPAEIIARRYLQRNLHDCYTTYINNRLQRYAAVLGNLHETQSSPLHQGLLLWDELLFFEVHEILEHAWMDAQGEEKLFLQAMIRAAGVYIKIEAGSPAPAERMAGKALPILERNRDRLAPFCDPERLINALQSLTQPPPKLLMD